MDRAEIDFVTYGHYRLEGEWYIGSRVVNRLYFIHGGGGSYIKNGKKYPLKSGHLYFFPATLKLGLENDCLNPVDHTYFDFIMHPMPSAESEVELCLEENPRLASEAEALTRLITRFEHFANASEEERELVGEHFFNVLKLIDEAHPLKAISDERISNTLLYIHKNYKKNITVQELAQNAYMETNHFIKVFKRCMNISPYQYIKDYRFSVAYSKLKSGARVGDVARQTGFLSVSAFSNAYKKKYGIYPGNVNKREYVIGKSEEVR